MKIYTSYFGNAKKLSAAGIKIIGVALYPPRFLRIPTIYDVAPKRDMLSDTMTEEEYVRRYKIILANLNLRQFFDTLKNLSFGQDVALCCYEKPDAFCHRHLLAEYLTEKTGIAIEEFGYEPVKNNAPDSEQQSLF